MEPENQDAGYENPDDGASSWAAPAYGSADADHFGAPSPLMSFDPEPAGLSHGGLDLPGLTLPDSLTDPSAHPSPHADGVSAGVYEPVPPAPHHHPSTIAEKVYDAVTNPPTPAPPPEDPAELERQREEKADQNAIGQHTPMSPEIRF